MDKKEWKELVIVGAIIILILMTCGFACLALWIRDLRVEIANMQLDYQAGDEALHARVNDVNEDLMEVQTTLPEMYMDISEVRSIIKNTNSALTRTNKQIKRDKEQQEPATEASPKSSIKEETMHEVFTAEETTQISQAVEEVESAPESSNDSSSDGMTFAGTYELTAYTATGNPTADGTMPSVGVTVACNDPALWHRWIYIEGYGTYYCHDTGGMSSNVIDLFVGSYDEAIQFGRRSANVYLVN